MYNDGDRPFYESEKPLISSRYRGVRPTKRPHA